MTPQRVRSETVKRLERGVAVKKAAPPREHVEVDIDGVRTVVHGVARSVVLYAVKNQQLLDRIGSGELLTRFGTADGEARNRTVKTSLTMHGAKEVLST